MKERIINIRVSFNMSDIPIGSTITSKEKVKEMVFNEILDVFGDDEYLSGIEIDIVDDE